MILERRNTMIKKTVLPIIISLFLFLLTGCSGVKQDGLSTPNSTDVTNQTVVDHSKIRPEIQIILDKLKDSFTDANSMVLGKREIIEFEPKNPQEFLAGQYTFLFQKFTPSTQRPDSELFKEIPQEELVKESVEYTTVVFQTEEKVGHLNKVIPGSTVVGGYILVYPGNLDSSANIDEKMMLTKEEQKYCIEQLYRGFTNKITQYESDDLNHAKDYALAIYFNGNKGIDEFHSEQINALSRL